MLSLFGLVGLAAGALAFGPFQAGSELEDDPWPDSRAWADEAGAAILEDFDPSQDEIVVIHDAAAPPLELACEVGEHGATLFADGVAVAFVPGAVEIDLAAVRLVAG